MRCDHVGRPCGDLRLELVPRRSRLGFGAPPVGDVAKDPADEDRRSVGGPFGRGASVDVEPAPGPLELELECRVRPPAEMKERVAEVTPAALRDEHGKRLADQMGELPAEHRCGRVVRIRDHTGRVRHHVRIGSAVEQIAIQHPLLVHLALEHGGAFADDFLHLAHLAKRARELVRKRSVVAVECGRDRLEPVEERVELGVGLARELARPTRPVHPLP